MPSLRSDCYDAIATAVFVLTPGKDGTPRYSAFNRTAQEWSGRPLKDVLGKCARLVHGNRFGDYAFERHLEVMRTGEPLSYDLELPLQSTPTWFRTTLTPETDEEGNVSRIVGTSINVSAEYDAISKNTSLATHNHETEQFIALAAHDLRAPMRNINTLAELLLDEFEDLGDGKVELISVIQEVAHLSGQMIADVLEHTQTAHIDQHHSAFDFDEMCKSIRVVLDPSSEHHINWKPQTLYSDKIAIQVVLRNLLENAIKHGENARMTIRIKVAAHDDDYLTIRVTDDGRGFDNPGRAFLETGSFRTDSGYGLLGIRRMIMARGGSIAVENNQEHRGSTVCFTIPGRIAPVGAQTSRKTSAPGIQHVSRGQ